MATRKREKCKAATARPVRYERNLVEQGLDRSEGRTIAAEPGKPPPMIHDGTSVTQP